MTERTIKILGVQFAANPDYKFGDPETPEMWMRTINLLTELRDRKPRVVLKAEPTNPQDEKAVMARAMGRKIGYVNRDQRDEVRQLLRLSKRGMLGAEVGEVIVGNHGCGQPRIPIYHAAMRGNSNHRLAGGWLQLAGMENGYLEFEIKKLS